MKTKKKKNERKFKNILDTFHKYNSEHMAAQAFGLSEDIVYDALVVAPSFTPFKILHTIDCIIATADRALQQGLDVLIDYVIENELPRVKELTAKNRAELFYIVLTASEYAIEKRIRSRGDLDMIERAKFLKRELDSMPENIGHLYDNTDKNVDEMVVEIVLNEFKS